jgi:hypothetical protein
MKYGTLKSDETGMGKLCVKTGDFQYFPERILADGFKIDTIK